MKSRVQSFDVLKTIAMILVVFCHYTTLSNSLLCNAGMTLCFIGVPIFFMVNGALLFCKPFDIRKHIKKIVSMYLVGTLWRLIYLVIPIVQNGAGEQFRYSKSDLIKYLFFWDDLQGVPTGHMWFMWGLIAIYIIFPVLYYAYHSDKKEGKYAIGFLLIFLFVTQFIASEGEVIVNLLKEKEVLNSTFGLSGITKFSIISTAGNVLVFFVLGGWIYEYLNETKNTTNSKIINHKGIASILFITSCIFMIVTKYLSEKTWNWTGALYINGYKRIPTFFAAVFLFILFYGFEMKENLFYKIIKQISTHTLGIYYLHWIISPIVVQYIPYGGFLMNVLKTIIVLGISLGISCLLGKIRFVKKMVI